jgi:translation initiation factor IF-1
MSKNDLIHFQGVVTKIQGKGTMTIKCDDNNMEIQGVLSGKMKKNKINVILGDRVRISISPYDLTHGLITYRYK